MSRITELLPQHEGRCSKVGWKLNEKDWNYVKRMHVPLILRMLQSFTSQLLRRFYL